MVQVYKIMNNTDLVDKNKILQCQNTLEQEVTR